MTDLNTKAGENYKYILTILDKLLLGRQRFWHQGEVLCAPQRQMWYAIRGNRERVLIASTLIEDQFKRLISTYLSLIVQAYRHNTCRPITTIHNNSIGIEIGVFVMSHHFGWPTTSHPILFLLSRRKRKYDNQFNKKYFCNFQSGIFFTIYFVYSRIKRNDFKNEAFFAMILNIESV